jgi:hypothetical protein
LRPHLTTGLPFSQRMQMHLVASTFPMLAMNKPYANTQRHAMPLGEQGAELEVRNFILLAPDDRFRLGRRTTNISRLGP